MLWRTIQECSAVLHKGYEFHICEYWLIDPDTKKNISRGANYYFVVFGRPIPVSYNKKLVEKQFGNAFPDYLKSFTLHSLIV